MALVLQVLLVGLLVFAAQGMFLERRGDKMCEVEGVRFAEGNEIQMRCSTCTCKAGYPKCVKHVHCMGCTHGSEKYQPGDIFHEGCQECECIEGGTTECKPIPGCGKKRREVSGLSGLLEAVGVRKRAEGGGCWARGRYVPVGESYGDGCSEPKCRCHWDGSVSCQQGGSACSNSGSVGGCFYQGRHYFEGQTLPKRNTCEDCRCMGGKVSCDYSKCGPVSKGCNYYGKFYEQGDWFDSAFDRCKTCICGEKSTVYCGDKGTC